VMLEEKGNVPVTGVVPYMELSLEDEDSLTERFDKKQEGLIDIAVIRYPRISNFTDFNVFERIPGVTVRYVTSISELHRPDMVILPGSKNTMGDLKWMRQSGLEAAVKKLSEDIPVFGICGGYQMLGNDISDPDGVEDGGSMRGMELLPVSTVLQKEKTRCQAEGKLETLNGPLQTISGYAYQGYEIHMGKSFYTEGGKYEDEAEKRIVVCGENPNVYGSYVHGLFDYGSMALDIVKVLAENKGVQIENGEFEDYQSFKEKQYDKLADILRMYMNMEEVYGMLREANLD
ncbi:MAG: cobyric acid synthase CobQ, partial [Lachnospiraceae bacterium]|nr:cobyric acid synthase CobQ [Lachnospiraceae bacterium]